jgi:Fe2+ transport system protein B
MIKIGGLLKSLAPTVAEAAGGPLAGMAVKMVASKIGVPNASVEKIEEILETQPEKAMLVKQADREFQDRIREMEIDLESFKAEVDDRKDARSKFADDLTPKIFAMLALIGFLGYVFMVTIQPPDANDDGVVNLILGYLGGLVSGISAFFFGGSNGKK